MEVYDFKVTKADAIIASLRDLLLPDMGAVWEQVVNLAESVDSPGSQITVTNGNGEVVILIGIAAARASIPSAA
jgi:hypothetical protein